MVTDKQTLILFLSLGSCGGCYGILMFQGCCILLSATSLLHLSSLALIPLFFGGISSSPFLFFIFLLLYCLPENLFNINGVLTVLYSTWCKLVSSGLQIACARVSVVYYTYPKYILGKERITTANNFVEKTLWFHYFRTMRKTI